MTFYLCPEPGELLSFRSSLAPTAHTETGQHAVFTEVQDSNLYANSSALCPAVRSQATFCIGLGQNQWNSDSVTRAITCQLFMWSLILLHLWKPDVSHHRPLFSHPPLQKNTQNSNFLKYLFHQNNTLFFQRKLEHLSTSEIFILHSLCLAEFPAS